eukprot:1298054-Prymnesium_polylepis.2
MAIQRAASRRMNWRSMSMRRSHPVNVSRCKNAVARRSPLSTKLPDSSAASASSSRKEKRQGINNAAYMSTIPMGQMVTSTQPTAKISWCSSKPSQRTLSSCARNECSLMSCPTPEYSYGRQYHARKIFALTAGVKQKAITSDMGRHCSKPCSAASKMVFGPLELFTDRLFRLPDCAQKGRRNDDNQRCDGSQQQQARHAISHNASTRHDPIKPIDVAKESEELRPMEPRLGEADAVRFIERCDDLTEREEQLELGNDAHSQREHLDVVNALAQRDGNQIKLCGLLLVQIVTQRKHAQREATEQ